MPMNKINTSNEIHKQILTQWTGPKGFDNKGFPTWFEGTFANVSFNCNKINCISGLYRQKAEICRCSNLCFRSIYNQHNTGQGLLKDILSFQFHCSPNNYSRWSPNLPLFWEEWWTAGAEKEIRPHSAYKWNCLYILKNSMQHYIFYNHCMVQYMYCLEKRIGICCNVLKIILKWKQNKVKRMI